MKKMISALLSAAMLISASVPYPTSAEKYGSGDDIVIFGDSIASGYGLSDSEYNYGQLIADYVSGSVTNYAVSGSTTADTLETINNLTSEQKSVLADAEYVVISAGAEDIMEYTSIYILNLCADINVLKEGYSAADIPERPDIFDISRMVDRQALMDYSSNPMNMLDISTKVSALRGHITLTKNDQNYQRYDRIIETRIMPALEEMVAEIKSVNPDAEILIQSIYNPMQFEQSYLTDNFPENYRRAVNLVIPVFTASSESYRSQLKDIDGIKIADVLASFSSTEESGLTEQSYSWYFTRLQESENRGIYPTQTGQVAIAASILNAMGKTTEKGSLLRDTFQNIENKDSYPAYALAEFRNLVDLNEPFVPQTTTTTATTTTSTSTASTSSTTSTSTTAPTTSVTVSSTTTTLSTSIKTSSSTTTASTVSSTSTTRTASASSTAKTTTAPVSTSTAPASTSTAPVTTKPPVQPDFSLGDVDGNGIVDSADASLVLRDYALTSTGSDSILNNTQKKAADINEDDSVDSSDASTILSYYSYTSTGGAISDMREWLKSK